MNLVKKICLEQTTTNPFEIALTIMRQESIPIHGPVHHIIDGASVMTALHNAGIEFDLDESLDVLVERALVMPGGTCGKWGMCGSASSVGAAMAIIRGMGPYSDSQYYKDDMHLVSRILENIANIGGPRCCKRNAFLAIRTAVKFIKETYGIELESTDICCDFRKNNQECIGKRCPFCK